MALNLLFNLTHCLNYVKKERVWITLCSQLQSKAEAKIHLPLGVLIPGGVRSCCTRAGLFGAVAPRGLNFGGVNFINLTSNFKVSQAEFDLRYEIRFASIFEAFKLKFNKLRFLKSSKRSATEMHSKENINLKRTIARFRRGGSKF